MKFAIPELWRYEFLILETMKKITFVLLTILFLSNAAKADIKLPAIFSDNMMLQQQSNAAIWGWAKPASRVRIQPSWSKTDYTTQTDQSGKWLAKIPTPKSGGPYSITISDGKALKINNVLIGEVWVCSGQSNMEMPLKGCIGGPREDMMNTIVKSANPNIRFFTIPHKASLAPENDCIASWSESSPETALSFSAVAFYFGRLLNTILGVPVGLIHSSYGGSSIEAWMTPNALEGSGTVIPTQLTDVPTPNRMPAGLFNGMISPILGYGIQGAIWYQGESNQKDPFNYLSLFTSMVKDWRKQWGVGEFPFYYVQIAPFQYNSSTSAYLREAQLNAAKVIPNSAMVVNMDANSPDNIHPPVKIHVGERLAYFALSKIYGMKGIPCNSPSLVSMEVKGSIVELTFDAPKGTGLTSFGKDVKGFVIADSTRRFVRATATILANKIQVFAPQIVKPAAVRYAFDDVSPSEIFSLEGLPVSSFRTDDWK